MSTKRDKIKEEVQKDIKENSLESNEIKKEMIDKVKEDHIPTQENQVPVETTVKDTFVATESSETDETNTPVLYDYMIDIPEKNSFNSNIIDKFTNKAKEIKLNKNQAQEIFNLWNQLSQEEVDKSNLEVKKAEDTLKEEWGEDYEFNLAKAAHMVKKFGGDDFVKILDQTGLGNNAKLIKTFHNISKSFIEDKFVGVDAKEPPPDIPRWHGMPMLKFNM